MKFLRLRFTVRTMLVGVMLAAIALVAVNLKRRSDEFGRRAAVHARLSRPGGGSIMGDWEEALREIKIFNSYHATLHNKYEYLKYHPWLSADPDPPPPAVSFTVQ